MATTPTYDQIESRVVAALVSFGVDPDDIRGDADLRQLDVDSLDVVELAHILAEEFGIDIEARDFVDVKTYGDALAAIRRRAGLT